MSIPASSLPNGPKTEHPESSPAAGPTPTARRRRWWLAIGCGLICGGAAVSILWFTYRPQYTATAVFKIAARPDTLLFPTADREPNAFEVYKHTHQQYVKSRFVLIAALRKPEAADLKELRDELDAVDWLTRNLRVDFPANGELMHISLSAGDPQEAAVLVNGVVDAYQKEVVDLELGERRKRLDELDKIRSEKESELRAKQSELKGLVKQLGSGERDALTLQQQIATQTLAALRTEMIATKLKLMRMKSDLASKKAAAERVGDSEKKKILQADLQQLERDIAIAAEQEKQLMAEAQKADAEAKSVGSSSYDVEMIRMEIGSIHATMKTASEEREKLLIEMRANPRISLLHKADVPGSPDPFFPALNIDRRTWEPIVAILVVLGAVFLPVLVVLRRR